MMHERVKRLVKVNVEQKKAWKTAREWCIYSNHKNVISLSQTINQIKEWDITGAYQFEMSHLCDSSFNKTLKTRNSYPLLPSWMPAYTVELRKDWRAKPRGTFCWFLWA